MTESPREADAPLLTADEERLLLQIARDSLVSALCGESIDVEEYPLTPRLREKHGAFVALRCNGEIRGCIGYTDSIKPLAEAVSENAVRAGMRDPRFEPLTSAEIPILQIEISALRPGDTPGSPFIPVQNISEIVLGRDGLYLEDDSFRGGGLLLPHVAGDQGWTVAQFLEGVSRKASGAADAWKAPGAKLYRFSAHIFREAEHALPEMGVRAADAVEKGLQRASQATDAATAIKDKVTETAEDAAGKAVRIARRSMGYPAKGGDEPPHKRGGCNK